MYQGTNPTALKSMDAVGSAMMNLLRETDYDQIAVKQICTRAKVSRQTFYNCFTGKEDILRFVIHGKFAEARLDDSALHDFDPRMVTRAYAKLFERDLDTFRLVIDRGQEHVIVDEINMTIASRVDADAVERDDPYASYYVALMAGAISNMLIRWMANDERIGIDELVNVLFEFFSGNYFRKQIADGGVQE